MDEDLTMLTGPARDGTPLEIGVPAWAATSRS